MMTCRCFDMSAGTLGTRLFALHLDPNAAHGTNVGRIGGPSMGIVSWLVVGAIAGYLAGFLVKGDESYGVIGHIVLGIVGAIVGGFLAGLVLGGNDYLTGINLGTVIVAVIGAVIAVIVWNSISGRTRTGRGAF
jgi:uncharacterized membrane protein YeaQ/YmgE (transglycosylase-associated protein family)